MQKKFKSVLHRILGALLVLTLLLGVAAMTACNNSEEPEVTESEAQTEEGTEEVATELPLNENGNVNVVVFAEDAPKGTKISSKNLEIVELPAENVPRNAVTNMDEVKGLYTNRDFYKGDYVIENRLVKKKPIVVDASTITEEIARTDKDFVIVTDFIKANTGEDIQANLQMLIDKNPGRTLFFPDGEYVINRSLETTSKPGESTSFYFSSGAVLRAGENWKNDGERRALICLGAKEKVNDINTPGSNFFIMGGTFIANGRGDGIALFYGRETLIKDVVILNSRYGIHIVHPTNANSSDSDIDDVTIIGNGLPNSAGIVAVGLDNTFSNARISNVQIGMSLSAAGFTNNCTIENTAKLENAVGIQCNSGDAWISNCTVLDCPIAFKLGSYSGFVKQCTAAWPSNFGAEHVAFEANALKCHIIGGKALFNDNGVTNIYLRASRGGNGSVVSPIFNTELCSQSDNTALYLAKGSTIISLPVSKKED